MKIFTYEEYREYQKQAQIYMDTHLHLAIEKEIFKEMYGIKEENSLLEEDEHYAYGDNEISKIQNPQDKIFRNILENKREVIYVIQKTLGEDLNLTAEMLQMCQISDRNIVYRIIGTNLFFLIKNQRKVDGTMPARVLSDMIKIIREARNNMDMRRIMKIPTVIPIIIYTGNADWNVSQWIQECQQNLFPFQKIGLGNYNILKMNQLNESELLQEDYFISKWFLLERKRLK